MRLFLDDLLERGVSSPSWNLYVTCYFFFFFLLLDICISAISDEIIWKNRVGLAKLLCGGGFPSCFQSLPGTFFLPRQWSNQYYLILIAVYSFLSSLNSLYILLLKNKLQYFSSPTEAMSIILRQSDRRLQRLHSTHKFAKLFCFWFIWCWSLPHRYDHILIIYAALWE